MGCYPIFLEMAGRACVVIGGGAVAERKVAALLEVGASVTIVSPSLSAPLEALAKAGKVRHVGRDYAPGDLAGHQFAFIGAGDGEVNAAAAREGRERGVWVNAADDPARCDFILPAVIRRGQLVVAVATGGTSPALTRAIREELETYFTEEYATLADIVAEVRRELRQHAPAPDGAAWRKALDADFRRLVADGKREKAKAYLLERLGAGRCG
ncbi:MAG: bifunctional precorrin-2 dehydrogenase/sirohydrochlorin ferrochelatase [Candidatus Rokuibacteriota bacterium]